MRMSVRAVQAAIALGLCVLFTGPAPARAAGVFVETNPSTVPVGDEVGFRASCDDNLTAATVTSAPTGKVTVSPRYGFLTSTARVPKDTKAGDYQVTLRCPDGATATSTLHVVVRISPARGPATGGGGTAPGRSAPMLIGGGVTAIAAGLILAVLSARRRRLG
ncbi:hypothetical protein [Mangrovihabitans endophyticus]|uniref:Uncharacterized protein n=1 Tax=Mangrovihabitans endophyticus TaxID=1751298 RepID=A0A8J3FQF2_9ACTN|nr:hypothetical protein [Mangrovihabitans endophyticus]GGL02800.1 hypothetical protein GCM10012284_41750 [Mangrovihabitans endophyticus]